MARWGLVAVGSYPLGFWRVVIVRLGAGLRVPRAAMARLRGGVLDVG